MAARVAIELSPAACRLIEIEGGAPWIRRVSDTQVLSFALLPPAGGATRAQLDTLRKRPVAVVVWGVPTDHRQVVVTGGSYQAMRREALGALASAGIDTRDVFADIAPGAPAKDRSTRRPVVVALAAAAPLKAAVAPLIRAGIRVRAVLTPAAALASLARTRRTLAQPGAIEAYVALDQTATCIALVRNGVLMTARELSSGYTTWGDAGVPRSLDDIAAHLADELREFFAVVGASIPAVNQVCVCGGLPDLRSMTVRLMEKLDVEVEPLDSLFGLDPDPLSDRASEFRERCAELRLAWAAAADWPPAIDLLRLRRRKTARIVLSRAAVFAGAAAGLAAGWQIQRSSWLRPQAPQQLARTVRLRELPIATTPAAPSPPSQPLRVAPPAPAPASTAAPRTPTASAVAIANSSSRPVAAPTTGSVRREPELLRPSRVDVQPVEFALPFDGSLGTILYSPDRKLAIIDGQIIGVGDEVRGARVSDITSTTVFLRDSNGKLRRLTLSTTR